MTQSEHEFYDSLVIGYWEYIVANVKQRYSTSSSKMLTHSVGLPYNKSDLHS